MKKLLQSIDFIGRFPHMIALLYIAVLSAPFAAVLVRTPTLGAAFGLLLNILMLLTLFFCGAKFQRQRSEREPRADKFQPTQG